MSGYLGPGEFVDSDSSEVVAFAQRASGGTADPVRAAVRLFTAVRDEIWYDPYAVSPDPRTHTASVVAGTGRAYCIPKAVLLAAAARATGIPARLGFADVRNHLQTPALRERMRGSELFVFHGYAELWLRGRWIKATPAFNTELCRRFGVGPQEFDGEHDALLHQYSADGSRHMEYVRDRGVFGDLPFGEIMAAFREHYGSALMDEAALPDDQFVP